VARSGNPITLACVHGLAAPGVLLAIVGGFFCYAGFTVSPEQAGSIVDALNWIRGLPFGDAPYTVVAMGPASFGGYNLIQARCRIVRAPDDTRGIKEAAKMSASLVGFPGSSEGRP
jgi:hypothetical protein